MKEHEQMDKMITNNQEENYVIIDVTSVQDVPDGKMRHFEVNGKEIMIANVDGKYYAVSDRCGHANASLSLGSLNGKVITCPLHGAQFDVTTGKKVRDFNLTVPSLDRLPDDFKKYTKYALGLVGSIKIHDQENYKLIIESDRIKLKMPTDNSIN
jgi:nitrite reductase/ring-hydroxylating ferredoxin subunit